MNFFEQQKKAKAKSRRIILAFIVFLLLQLGVVYVLASEMTRSLFLGSPEYWSEHPPVDVFTQIDETALIVAVVFGAVLTILFLFRRISFWTFPSLLPRKMGAIQVLMGSDDPAEEIYYNIVSEMALASGIPVPEVYVLKFEKAINAFTSGHSHQNANVVVTQGALDHFTRDELQAVIGHEFGHIVSGDVRANINLLSMAFSFSSLFTVGYHLLRIMRYGPGRRSNNSKDNSSGQLLAIAIGIMVLGAVGSLASRLVSSMFSRQREYLADALSVQFTRYPASLASALAKIRDRSGGSVLSDANAAEVSAVCFSSSLTWMSSVFDTHPPLNDRINRVDKSFLEEGSSFKKELNTEKKEKRKNMKPPAAFGEKSLEYLATLGLLTEEDSAIAGSVIEEIKSSDLGEFLNAYGVEPIIYSMLLSKDPLEQVEQEKIIQEKTLKDISERVSKITRILQQNKSIQKYSLVEILAPLFSQISVSASVRILKVAKLLIDQDKKVMPFESFLYLFIKKYSFGLEGDGKKLSSADITFLIYTFAEMNVEHPEVIEAAKTSALQEYFGKSVRATGVHGNMEQVLFRLSRLSLKNKEKLVKALMKAVLFDDHLNREEFESFRIVCDAMEVPAPPLKFNQECR